MRLPSVRQKVETEMGKARSEIDAKLLPSGPAVTRHLALPREGRQLDWIINEMNQMDNEAVSDVNWRHGKLSGAVYHGGEDVEVRMVHSGRSELIVLTPSCRVEQKVINAATQKYIYSNPLHPDVFPGMVS